MKHFCILLLFSVTAVLSAAATQPPATAKPAATTTAKPAEAKPAATTTAKPAEAKPAATTSTAKPAEAKPAATTSTAKPATRPATKPASVLTSIYRSNPEPSAFADQERAELLLSRRAELVQKIHDERKRLMEEDVAAKKLRDEILLLNRKLASLLEEKKSLIELNSQLNDLDLAISRLKPAPPPEPADKTKADDKAVKDDKTGKDKKE